MPESFDPYYRWLGIPPKDRPANHYRLLGIDLFEPNPEVIRDGAEQRMAHVRTYQLGPHSALSQTILNELAAAKACLSDPERKTRDCEAFEEVNGEAKQRLSLRAFRPKHPFKTPDPFSASQ